MDKKSRKNGGWQLLGWMILFLMLVQIIMGIGWGILNLGHQPRFHETENYIKAAETLIIDEYMGILYPLLIRFCMLLEKGIGIPYYTLLYLLQLLAAVLAGRELSAGLTYSMLSGKVTKGACAETLTDEEGAVGLSGGPAGRKNCCKWIRRILLICYMVTFPLLLQLHLAVLPESLLISAAAVMVKKGMALWKAPESVSGRKLMGICGLWLVCGALLPEYSWILGSFVVCVLLKVGSRNRKWLMRLLLALVCTGLSCGVVAQTTQTPGSMGRIQNSVNASLMQRFVWPDFLVNSYFWEPEIAETFSSQDLLHFSRYPEAVIYEFGPVLEERYGLEAADRIYGKMALANLKVNTREAVIGVSRDSLANLCPNISVQLQLRKNESSLSGWNYVCLQKYAQGLTKYYLRISLAGWNFMLLAGIVRWAAKAGVAGVPGAVCRGLKKYLPVLILMLFMAGWYTLSCALQDYKSMGVIVLMWVATVGKVNLKKEN